MSRKWRSFADVKADIIKQNGNAKHFTKKFYEIYKDAYSRALANFENAIDDSYLVGHVRLFHSYDEVYASKFYNKNSTGYCVFLEYCKA